jgi:hypothetical protein
MEQKKRILVLIILVFVLIVVWVSVLKPKKSIKNYKKGQISEKSFSDIDVKKIEENFEIIKRKFDEISEMEKLKLNKVFVLKDPLKAWLPEKNIEGKILKEEKKQEVQPPNFYISGIVYDEKKPYVIIDDEIKSEGEIIGNFIIQKIYEDRIVVKDEAENYFVLKFDYEKGEKK